MSPLFMPCAHRQGLPRPQTPEWSPVGAWWTLGCRWVGTVAGGHPSLGSLAERLEMKWVQSGSAREVAFPSCHYKWPRLQACQPSVRLFVTRGRALGAIAGKRAAGRGCPTAILRLWALTALAPRGTQGERLKFSSNAMPRGGAQPPTSWACP